MKWKSTESTSSRRKEKLLKFFSTYDTTQDIFVFLRLLVAIQICSQRELYEPIIQGPGGNYSLEVVSISTCSLTLPRAEFPVHPLLDTRHSFYLTCCCTNSGACSTSFQLVCTRTML
uniref:Uncharacterized protein n=1 Tax=Aegilops tauschii subsp. strangulata TaxID=200361 RepID=A0A453N1P7_AEGTS